MPQIENGETEFEWKSADYRVTYDVSKELVCLSRVSNATLSELGEEESYYEFSSDSEELSEFPEEESTCPSSSDPKL